MSRQPRKVFGFTGSAKYGPVADKGDKEPLVAPASGEMDRNGDENDSSSDGCYDFWCKPEGPFCTCITCAWIVNWCTS